MHLCASDAPLALNANHLRPLYHANFFTDSQMHEGTDAVRKPAVRIWDAGRVVGNEEPEFEFRVIV